MYVNKWILILVVSLSAGCTQFGAGLAVLSGQGDRYALQDSTDKINKNLKSMAISQPVQTIASYEYDNADIFQYVDNQQLLVGALEYTGLNINPKHRELILYNMQSGEEIWRYDREELTTTYGNYQLVSTYPNIVLMANGLGKRSLTALSIKDGSVLWNKTLNSQESISVVSGLLLIYETKSTSQAAISAFNLSDGTIVWKESLKFVRPQAILKIEALSKGALLVAAKYQVYQLAISDGKSGLLWGENNKQPIERAKLTNQGLVIATQHKIALWRNGKTHWVKKISQTPIYMSGNNKRIYYYTKHSKKKNNRLYALSASTGKTVWSRTVKNNIFSSLVFETNMLWFTTPDKLYRISRSGKVKSINFEDKFVFGPVKYSLPDFIQVKNKQVIINREMRGVISYSTSGKYRWFQTIYSYSRNVKKYTILGDYYKFYDYQLSYNQSLESIAKMSGIENIEVSDAQKYASFALDSYDNYKTVKKFLDYKDSLDMAQNLEVRIELGQMLTGMVYSHGDAMLASLQRDTNLSDLVRGLVERDTVYDYHINSFKNNYYLKPFSTKNIRGLTVVNTDSGKRFDIASSPQIPYPVPYRYVPQAYSITPDGTQIAIIGSGMNADKFEYHTRASTRTINPGILRYDLKQAEFTKQSPVYEAAIKPFMAIMAKRQQQYDESSRKAAAERKKNQKGMDFDTKMKLINTCRSYGEDLRAYKKKIDTMDYKYCKYYAFEKSFTSSKTNYKVSGYMIKNGYDINSQDEYDSTIMHNLIGMDKPDAIKRLLKMSPNLSIKTKYGKTALDTSKGYEEIVSVDDYTDKKRKSRKNITRLLENHLKKQK